MSIEFLAVLLFKLPGANMVLICLGIPIINVKLTTIAEIRVD